MELFYRIVLVNEELTWTTLDHLKNLQSPTDFLKVVIFTRKTQTNPALFLATFEIPVLIVNFYKLSSYHS